MSPAAQGRRVRARLDVLQQSDKWLAEQIGETQPQMSRMLNGERKGGLTPVDAWRIARATGLTELYILYGDRQLLAPEVLRSLPPDD
jgi:transcriptional regulator with XRE-family HTH domain